MDRGYLADLTLRIGAAFAFLFPAINALYDPYSWLGYFPKFMQGVVPDIVLLHTFGAIEVLIALWILSGKYIFWPSCVATLMLIAIVLFDSANFQILFRDLSIAAITFSLAIRHAHIRKVT
jgi:hypothetical protein